MKQEIKDETRNTGNGLEGSLATFAGEFRKYVGLVRDGAGFLRTAWRAYKMAGAYAAVLNEGGREQAKSALYDELYRREERR